MSGLDDLDGLVEARRREENLPGVALARVTRVEGTVDCRVWGVADLASGAPLGTGAAFRVGSLTKLVTAVAALRLADRGAIRLDDPVRRYAPWLAMRGARAADLARLTLRHLLTHRSGLPRGPYELAPRSTVERLRDLAGMSLAFAPGEGSKYSNLGYGLAAHALAVAAGRPFHELARELVLAPAGMEGASFASGSAVLATGHQRGHYRSLVRRADRLQAAPELPALEGAGDLIATAADIARLAAALGLGSPGSPGSPRLLSPAALAELLRPPSDGGAARSFGLALRWSRRWGGACLEQDAGHSGFFALLRIVPQEGVAGVALCNRCTAFYPIDEILDAALAPLVTGGAPPAARSVESLERYAGDYASPRGALAVRLAGDRLELRADGEAIALTRHGRGRFIQEGGPFADHLLRFAFAGAAGAGVWEMTAGPHRWTRQGRAPAALLDDDARRDDPGFAPLVGSYRRDGYGDIRVFARQGRLWLSMSYADEEELQPDAGEGFPIAGGGYRLAGGGYRLAGGGYRLAGGGYRLAGGAFAGESVRFETTAGEAVAVEAGSMRFVRVSEPETAA